MKAGFGFVVCGVDMLTVKGSHTVMYSSVNAYTSFLHCDLDNHTESMQSSSTSWLRMFVKVAICTRVFLFFLCDDR
jgi:hypothetical protein